MRGQWVVHQGKRMYIHDLTNLTPQTLEIETDISDLELQAEPLNSVCYLANIAGTPGNLATIDVFVRSSKKTEKHTRHIAVIGISGLRKSLVELFSRLSGKNCRMFDSLDAAKDWLASAD